MIPQPIKSSIKELGLPDDTLNFALTGYPFIRDTCRKLGRDVFDTRFFLERVSCMTGPEAAKLFYDERFFQRHGAAPAFLQKTLLGEGGVQGLDGADHEHRKALFMSCFDAASLNALLSFAAHKWDLRVLEWEKRGQIVLLDELAEMFCDAMMQWCGIPVEDLAAHTRDFRFLIEGASALTATHVRARTARKRLDRLFAGIVRRQRRDHFARADSVLARFCEHRDKEGQLLPDRVVAVELNNLVRPTVAVAWYCAALALTMHRHPDLVPDLGDEAGQRRFVNEVRRLHPFFPMIAGQARRTVELQGHVLPQGRVVFLDVFGTNRDPRTYWQPDEFRPERFEEAAPGPHSFIPQGGGDHFLGHRCAGEWLTEGLMRLCLNQLNRLGYSVPRQDLSVAWTRMPARPESGFLIRDVRSLLRQGAASRPQMQPSVARADVRRIDGGRVHAEPPIERIVFR